MTKKYYAIREGKKIGVFESWDEAKTYVIGHKGAIYKSFKTYEEAKSFVTGIESTKALDDINEDEIVAYVDGSYNINTEVFGYGVILIDGKEEITFKDSQYDENLSNQRNVAGEVYGSMRAIKEAIIRGKKKIYLHFDYMGIKEWAEGNWKTNIDLTKDYKKFIDEKKKEIDIEFIKVKAHSNDKYNDIADKLAKEAVGIE